MAVWVATLVVAALVAGSCVYCLLSIIAVRRYLAVRPLSTEHLPPISVLKPLSGLDLGLEENLRSFFTQEYPDYELLFSVRCANDPAAAVVDRLKQEFPTRQAALLVTGDPPYPNHKVFALDCMTRAARHDILVMSDSDIRAGSRFLETVAAEFGDTRTGLITCPYRAVPGPSFWSAVEAVMMNTEFLSGVLTARMLEGMKFAIGPTIAARRGVLTDLGGFDVLQAYLAEDFVMGKLAAERGHGVVLSSFVIEHHIGSTPFHANASHRLRWCRSTRRSRPAGYAGQVFTNPTPLALGLLCLAPGLWPLATVALLLRAMNAWAVAGWVLHDPLCSRRWWLIPLADLISFAFWVAGFFGSTIQWRGRKYLLLRDGRFEPTSGA
jgi:ceramide glucosyltransferase